MPETGFPSSDVALTHLLVVRDLAASRRFYLDVLGARLYREYGGTSVVLDFNGAWLLLVTGGGPTPGKPDATFEAPRDPRSVSHAMTLRVRDCRAARATLEARGARFLAPSEESESEVRAFFRDPDGHLIEISESR